MIRTVKKSQVFLFSDGYTQKYYLEFLISDAVHI